MNLNNQEYLENLMMHQKLAEDSDWESELGTSESSDESLPSVEPDSSDSDSLHTAKSIESNGVPEYNEGSVQSGCEAANSSVSSTNEDVYDWLSGSDSQPDDESDYAESEHSYYPLDCYETADEYFGDYSDWYSVDEFDDDLDFYSDIGSEPDFSDFYDWSDQF